MVVWFSVIAVMGLIHISDAPSVLAAINPWYALDFLLTHGTIGLVTLGAVFLAVTGGEALYADLGHFGRKLFVSRRALKPSAQSGMPLWQDHLFIAMSRSANDATDYFQISTGRVVEVGTQVTI